MAPMTRIIMLAAALAIALPIGAAEKKIQRKDLPAAVERAVQKEEANGATVKNIVLEREGGKTTYEIETTVRGHSRDLIVDAAGTIVEAEEEVSIDAVPPAVKAALEGSGTIQKIEAVT